MSHSSGKGSKAYIHRAGERPQKYTQYQLLRVSSLDTRHIESMVESGMIQWGKCNVKYGMERSIFLIYRSLYWWEKCDLVGQEKSALSKSAFVERWRHGTLLWEREPFKSVSYRCKEIIWL